MRRLMAGEPLHECGSLLRVTLGGWFRIRATGGPAILTCEHVLTPDPLRNPPPAGRRVTSQGILDRSAEGILLCHAEERGSAVARVLASYPRGPQGEAAELDACIAEPLDASDATPDIPLLPWTPGIGAPVAGNPVAKFTRGGGLRYGRVIAVGQVDHRSSTRHDLIIASEDGRPFAVAGDSGALVVDLHERAVIGMHVGELQRLELGGRSWPSLWRAQRILPILDAFALDPWETQGARP